MARHSFLLHAAAAAVSLAAGVLVAGTSTASLWLGCAIALGFFAHYGVTENARLLSIASMVVIAVVAGIVFLIIGLGVECQGFESCPFE